MDKITLATKLKELDDVPKKIIRLEQYSTDVSTAVDFLLFADSCGGIMEKAIADFGCGNGILGVGASILGARSVDMYDLDERMISVSLENIKKLRLDNVVPYKKDFFDVNGHYDTIISNPPFGFQSTFRIEAFIEKLKDVSDSFFFLYKDNQKIRLLAGKNALSVRELGDIALPKSAKFHTREKLELPVCVVYR